MSQIYIIAAGIYIGAAFVVSTFFAMKEFQRHDYKASWWAYVGLLLPLALVVAAAY